VIASIQIHSNNDNSKGTIILNSVTDCSESKGILPKRDRKCQKAKNEDFFMVLDSHTRRKGINNLIIYHQNIRSLNRKKDEISIMLQKKLLSDLISYALVSTMSKEDTLNCSVPGYKLANIFCHEICFKGGVCILARSDIIYQRVDLNKLHKEKTFEITAVKLNNGSTKVILCCVYRSPSGNPNYFLILLEKTLELSYQPNISFLICDDLNINYLMESTAKERLESIMKTFNQTQAVAFPTRV
jgi:hypothetical protein